MMNEQNSAGGKNQNNKSMMPFVWLGVAVAVAAAVAGVGVYKVYAKNSTDKFSLTVAGALNLPAVGVADEKISYLAYVGDLKAIHTMRDYDKAQRDGGAAPDRSPGADLTEEQMSDQVLWRLVNNSLVNDAAKKYDVTVEDQDVQNLKEQMMQQFKDAGAVAQELMKRYGCNMSVYEQKVMRPFILQTKLAKKLKDDAKMKEELKAKAEQVLQEVKNGGDFAALATQYNEDSTRERGGDLGWFGKGEMAPEFEKATYSLKKGEVYPTIVESVYGYHLVRLDDRKIEKVKNEKGQTVNVEKVRASQVLFRFTDLLSYLEKAAKNAKIKLYLNVHNPFAELRSQTSTQR